jgi:hypothetical protein
MIYGLIRRFIRRLIERFIRFIRRNGALKLDKVRVSVWKRDMEAHDD